MTTEEKFNQILVIIDDYREELIKDPQTMDNLMSILGRGDDIDSEEINNLHEFLKNKINEIARMAH